MKTEHDRRNVSDNNKLYIRYIRNKSKFGSKKLDCRSNTHHQPNSSIYTYVKNGPNCNTFNSISGYYQKVHGLTTFLFKYVKLFTF